MPVECDCINGCKGIALQNQAKSKGITLQKDKKRRK